MRSRSPLLRRTAVHKLALFDLDGTLLNTLADIAGACNYALVNVGFPVYREEEYKGFIGRGPVYLITSALPAYARDEATVAYTRQVFQKYYLEHSAGLTKPYDGTIDMLRTVRSAGIKTVIYSNKPHDGVCLLAERFFKGLYDFAVGFRDGVPPKPEPDTGLEIIRKFGASANETAYIGDSDIDMQTAKNIGAYAIGVTWGFRTRLDLEEGGADIIIDKMSELAEIIIDK